MAHAFVNVTEGSGKKLAGDDYTDGANTVIDERMTLGLPKLATYSVIPAANATTATANSHMAQLMAGASLHVYVHRIQIFQVAMAGAITAINLGIVRLSTAGTGGTAGSQTPFDSTDTAAGATSMTLPTVKGTEGSLIWNPIFIALAALPTGPSPMGLCLLDLDFDRLRGKPIRIPAGAANGIAVKNVTALATATYVVQMLITEQSF